MTSKAPSTSEAELENTARDEASNPRADVGITTEDREQIKEFLDLNPYERTPDALRPDAEEQ